MARLFFGGTGGDVIAQVGSGDGDYEPTTATFDVYRARTGGSAVTDLTDKAGTAITAVDPDADGRVQFFGEDGYEGSYWLESIAVPGSDRWRVDPAGMSERLAALEDINFSGFYSLPVGGIPQADLDAATEAKLDNAIPKTVVDAKGDLIVGTAADTVGRAAAQFNKLVSWDADGDIVGTDPAAFATVSGGVDQFPDWADTTPTDGDVPVWNGISGGYEPSDLSGTYAGVGSDGRLATANEPLWYVPICVVNEGDPPPTTFPVGGIVYARPAAASVIPLHIGFNSARGPNNVVVTLTDAVAVGDWIVLAVGTSGEVTLPSTYTVALSAGAASGGWSSAVEGHNTGSVQADLIVARCTTAIPSGSTITVTANQTRAHIMCEAVKVPNLATSSIVDQTGSSTGSSNTTLAKTVGPTGATTQANELALCAVAYNSGTGTQARTYDPSNGWAQVGTQIDSDTGTGGRGMTLAYRVLTATGAVTGNFQVTTTDGATGAWVGVIATLKAA